MPSTQEPRSGVYHSWDLGESGYKAQMDTNLLMLSTFAGLSAIDRDLTAPPGSPADGDLYLPAATATGAWASHENEIAIWREPLVAWEFIDPTTIRGRLLLYIEDENRLVVWNGTNWLQGVNFS